MGDMGEIFQVMKERKKEKRSQRLAQAKLDGWSKHTEHHWYRIVDGEKINYWPSSGLCMIGNRRFNINSKKIQKMIGGK